MFTPVLRVRDVELSLAFYTQVLGFQGNEGLPGIDGKTVFAEAALGDSRIMLTRHRATRLFSSQSCGIELYLTLPDTYDIQQYHAQLKAQDVRIIEDMHDELWGDRAFTIADPDGYHLIIAQPIRYAAVLPIAHRHIA